MVKRDVAVKKALGASVSNAIVFGEDKIINDEGLGLTMK